MGWVAMKALQRSAIFVLCLISAVILVKCGDTNQAVPPLTISPASLPNGTAGTLYTQTIQVGGGVAPFNWSVSGELPHNLELVPDAGNMATISGMPDTVAQGVVFTIKVTDSSNRSGAQSYTVSILAEPDALSFSPTTGLSFSPQLIGTASATEVETVINNSPSAIAISGIGLTGINATDFGQTNDCGSSLAAGANCSVKVSFTPTLLGPRIASITMTDSTMGSPHSVPLSGVGITSGVNATLSAGTLTFGNQLVGTTSPAQSLVLSNYGTMTLNVTFTPPATGSASGTISVTDNAPSSPQIVLLGGTGVTSTCIPQGGGCFGPGPNNCCPAPFPHHSFCSNPTGHGTCIED
jgi:hypothetical protein